MTRISIITDAPFAKDFRTRRNVEAFNKLKLDVTVLDQGFYVEESLEALAAINLDYTLISSPIPTGGMAKLKWHLNNRLNPLGAYQERSMWAYEQLVESNPDIIHCINPLLLEASLEAASKTGAKLVYEAYEYWPDYLYMQGRRIPKGFALYLAHAEKSAADELDAFITVSQPLADWYSETCGFKDGIVIYNANIDEGEVVRELSEVALPLKVVFSGQLLRDRNIDLVIKALPLLKHPVNLIIYGDGPDAGRLQKLSVADPSPSHVSFKGYVPQEELIGKLSEADIGVHLLSPETRQMEGALPNKLFDYMRAGLTLLSVDSSGIRSFEDAKQFTVFLDELSSKAIARSLDKLSENLTLVSKMKERALELSANYTKDKMIDALVDFYKEKVLS